MPMTVVITRNTPGRFGGFLASCMLPVAPGVYLAPQLRAGVRERLWRVMLQWAGLVPPDGGVMLLWRDQDAPGQLAIRTIGWPKREIADHEGLWLAVGELTAKNDADELAELAAASNETEPEEGDAGI